MIIDDQGLEAVVWITKRCDGRWGVYVGDGFMVFLGTEAKALEIERKLKDAMMHALKVGIVSLASGLCDLCMRKTPIKKRTIKGSLHLFHWNGSLGWQPCDAEYLYLAMMQDTKERAERAA